jgi:hypothetical protein
MNTRVPRMSRASHVRYRFLAVLAAIAMLAIAAPAAANTPERITETDTSLVCDAVTGDAGELSVSASLSSLGGSAGSLLYWQAGSDPSVDQPTLESQGVDISIGADGVITATFDMFTPGDLGFEGGGEPIFVGVAEVTAFVSPTGEVEEIIDRFQNGNHRFHALGSRQSLAVTGGQVNVPTAGTFDLADAGCVGEELVVRRFTTQPDALITDEPIIHLACSVETATGFVNVGARSSPSDTYLVLEILDGADFYFGLMTAPDITAHGVTGVVEAANFEDPTAVATAGVSVRFSVIDRFKFRIPETSGWFMKTEYVYSVSGAISVNAPGISLDLPMESCIAFGDFATRLSH